MSDNAVPQQVFTLADAEPAKLVAYHLYDMSIDTIIETSRYTKVTDAKIKDLELKPISIYAPSHYNYAFGEMVKVFGTSRRNMLAALVTGGISRLQHRFGEDCKQMSKIRTQLFKTDFKLAVELFGNCEELFPYQKGRRRHNNIYADKNGVYAPLAEMGEALCVSVSELSAIACAEAILSWKCLPESARSVFQKDVEMFDAHATAILKRGANIQL